MQPMAQAMGKSGKQKSPSGAKDRFSRTGLPMPTVPAFQSQNGPRAWLHTRRNSHVV